MKAVILAGGKGTRMGKLTGDVPKPLLMIGDQPLLVHQVVLLKQYGITEIVILVNYLKDQIIELLGNGSKYGVHISYFEEPQPLGTTGGIKEIENQLTDDFLVVYGDVMMNMDIGRLIRFHYKKGSKCTLAVHPNDHPFDSDIVETDENSRILQFHPKPHTGTSYLPNLVNAGIYIVSPEVLQYIERGVKADFGRDIFPLICKKMEMYGYNTAEYLKDMGTPERLEEVNKDYRSGKIARSSYAVKQKAIFLDRDGVLNEEISFISKPEDMRLYNFTPSAVRKINHSEYKAIVVTNQSVIARNLCTLAELKAIHNKLETDLGKERAKLDAIYFCPHHPDKGFPEERAEYKIDCQCRKPKPGMFLEAARDFNLDLSTSFMIGDNERDVEAGINAGCVTVGVMTGYGMRKTNHEADFFFTNLLEAVSFIIDDPYLPVFEKMNIPRNEVPFIVLIGGKARSGKSTLASYLKMKFEQQHKRVLKINLDNWILPEDQRGGCSNVYDRFQLPKIETDIKQILAGIEYQTETYVNHPDRKAQKIVYRFDGHNVVIIEGVVALSSKALRDIAHDRIFINISPQDHRARIEQYYRWRGKQPEEIERLYNERMNDEYLLIEKERKFADRIVNSAS